MTPWAAVVLNKIKVLNLLVAHWSDCPVIIKQSSVNSQQMFLSY